MRARQGLHSSPSWPRGLACRRPSSAGSATSRSSPVPPSPARESRRRWHARSPGLVTTRPSLLHSRDQVRECHAATLHRRLASIRRRRGHRRGFLSSWFSVSTRARCYDVEGVWKCCGEVVIIVGDRVGWVGLWCYDVEGVWKCCGEVVIIVGDRVGWVGLWCYDVEGVWKCCGEVVIIVGDRVGWVGLWCYDVEGVWKCCGEVVIIVGDRVGWVGLW
ncbi:hypothetical protein DEO72_LG11g1238 [Vigna unguiculata]|uniref:Uncharacterized protein n=1 Tax=Vigna unguiculata TaxID=3917 RepID=A0A4D6NNY2_VIGUN|nr:hypothetical protein DEO72_LG11g1238 [Vigna unguiculata]